MQGLAELAQRIEALTEDNRVLNARVRSMERERESQAEIRLQSEKRLEELQQQLLEAEEEKGQLLRHLASATRETNELQRERMGLAKQRDELHDQRFAFVEQILERHDQRLANIEQGDWEESTGIRRLKDMNRKAHSLQPGALLKPEAGKNYFWYAIGAISAAVATGFALAYKLIFG